MKIVIDQKMENFGVKNVFLLVSLKDGPVEILKLIILSRILFIMQRTIMVLQNFLNGYHLIDLKI